MYLYLSLDLGLIAKDKACSNVKDNKEVISLHSLQRMIYF